MHIKEIIKRAGGTVAVARLIGKRHSTVSQWGQVPIQHVAAISAASGLAPQEIRTDLSSLFSSVTIENTEPHSRAIHGCVSATDIGDTP